jgi:PKD repeat protein
VSKPLRPSTPAADHRRAVAGACTPRRLALLLGAVVLLAAGLLQVTPAGADVVSETFGVQRRAPLSVGELQAGGPFRYHKGPVLNSSDVYVIYWDPNHSYRGDWERLIDGFFQGVGEESGALGNVFGLDGQYRDAQGIAANQLTFRGSYKDEDLYPTTAEGGNCTERAAVVCLTDRQIQAELKHMITSVDPPLPGATGTPIYYMLTPPGVTVCTDASSSGTCSNSAALEEEAEKITKKEVRHPAETGICGYHSAIGLAGSNPIPYVVQPWIAGYAGLYIEKADPLTTSSPTPDVLGCQDDRELEEPNQLVGLNPFGNYAEGLADVIINDLSIEQRDVVTDPFLTGWYQNGTNAEQGDGCQFDFGPPPKNPAEPNPETHAGTVSDESIAGRAYYLSWAFNSTALTRNEGVTCASGVSLDPYFTSPNPVNVGDIVGFNGTESNIALNADTAELEADEPYVAPVYSWNFGDGATVKGTNDASEFHTYQYGGKYTVTLTVTDSAGNVGSTTREITVNGPARPVETPPSTPGGSGSGTTSASGSSGSGSNGGSSSTGTTGTGTGTPTPTVIPAPVASAAVASRTLKTDAHKGLVVRYTVNEQVAGHFEVLLSRAIAHRLGISGAAATGLPAGTPAELVIAKAILVTTKGGSSTVDIQFSKSTAARLGRVHKVSLLLRLIVRNAAAHSPATTTVLSAITLAG